MADTIHIIRGFNREVREPVLSSLASGHMVTTAEERQHGVLMLDIGAGVTDFAFYRDGAAYVTGVVAVGSAQPMKSGDDGRRRGYCRRRLGTDAPDSQRGTSAGARFEGMKP